MNGGVGAKAGELKGTRMRFFVWLGRMEGEESRAKKANSCRVGQYSLSSLQGGTWTWHIPRKKKHKKKREKENKIKL